MECLIGERQELEDDPLFNRQPVQFLKGRRDVVMFFYPGDQSGCTIHDVLEFSGVRFREAIQDAVTVVQL